MEQEIDLEDAVHVAMLMGIAAGVRYARPSWDLERCKKLVSKIFDEMDCPLAEVQKLTKHMDETEMLEKMLPKGDQPEAA